MTEKQVLELVRARLKSFMNDFDAANRGNRLSRELIAGLGGFLENFIVGIILSVREKEENENKGDGK